MAQRKQSKSNRYSNQRKTTQSHQNIVTITGDLVVNATEGKKLTNHRASGSDDATRIAPKTLMTLEECMEYIQQDECIEVTPKNIRMRKVILNEEERKKASKSLQSEAVEGVVDAVEFLRRVSLKDELYSLLKA